VVPALAADTSTMANCMASLVSLASGWQAESEPVVMGSLSG